MITNFENITFELTDYETDKVLPVIIRGLKTKIGKHNAVSNRAIVKGLKNIGIKTSEPRVRKMIQYIRISGIIENLIATNKGYYIAETKDELENYLESLLQRIASMEMTAKQIQYQLDKWK